MFEKHYKNTYANPSKKLHIHINEGGNTEVGQVITNDVYIQTQVVVVKTIS